MLFFQVLFLWNFSRLWKYIIRNSHYKRSNSGIYSAPLIYVSILLPIPLSSLFRFMIYLNVRLPTVFLLFKIVLTTLVSSHFHMNFRIIFCKYLQKICWDFSWDCIKSLYQLRENWHLNYTECFNHWKWYASMSHHSLSSSDLFHQCFLIFKIKILYILL